MIGIELFSGVGGMSLGAKAAGIDVKLAVEINSKAAQTFKTNHPTSNVLNIDITRVQEINVQKNRKRSILFGGPPCQGFSLSNQKTRNSNNPQNWLFREFARLANNWKPDWVLLENVSGLLKTEKGIFFEWILSELKKIGYTCTYKTLNSVSYGVPQKRERVFIVGSLHGIRYEFPVASSLRQLTVMEAISDLPNLYNGANELTLRYKNDLLSEYSCELRGDSKMSYNNNVTKNDDYIIQRYQHIPQGGNWSNIPDYLMKNYKDHYRCHGWLYHRLNYNEPSVVLGNYRKNMLIHPIEDRGLSVREAARIQSFPDSFHFCGGLTEMQQQVANAVPPKLSKAVFENIMKYK